MNLDHLRYFVKLAETRHYTNAARQLCISQPSLSHAIRQLEEELGLPLFEKSGRNTRLTRWGEEFLRCVTGALNTLDTGVEAMQRTARGEGLIRLGFLRALGTDYIPRQAARYLADHPGGKVRFSFHSDRTHALLQGLAEGQYDLVFCSRPTPDQNLTAVPVTRQELVVIVPRQHPLAGRGSIDLAEAARYPFIAFSEPGLREVVDGMLAAVQARPVIACETEEDQVIAGLVAQGFGIAVVPRMSLLDKLDVSVLTISNPPRWRNIYLVQDESVCLTPAARQFRDYLLRQSRGEELSDTGPE